MSSGMRSATRHLDEEPFEPAGRQDEEMAAELVADDAEGVLRAARDERRFPLAPPEGLARDPELALAQRMTKVSSSP